MYGVHGVTDSLGRGGCVSMMDGGWRMEDGDARL